MFSAIVLGTVAPLYKPSAGTCDLYRFIDYPSYDFQPILVSTDSSPTGNLNACRYSVSVAVLGIAVGFFLLIDAIRLARGAVKPIGRSAFVYVLEWFSAFALAALWCVSAIYTGLGYVSTCSGSVCYEAANDGAFASQAIALTAVIFAWLSLVPWSLDFGLVTREYFRRLNYRRQMKEDEEIARSKAQTAAGGDAPPTRSASAAQQPPQQRQDSTASAPQRASSASAAQQPARR